MEKFYTFQGDAILGSGATGIVRKATSKRGGRILAIKTITISSEGCQILTDKDMQSLTNEVKIASKYKHPNMVRTIEAFWGKETFDIVMEYASGGEVTDSLLTTNSFSELQGCRIVQQVNLALAYLHRLDIAHRDVKPGNILYADEGSQTVKLIDFGFAKLNLGNGKAKGRRSTLLGTAPFMAPELFKEVDGKKLMIGDQCVSYDLSVDMWALGVFAYLILFGLLPFGNDGKFFGDFAKAMNDSLHFPEERRKEYSPDCCDYISRCLEKDPEMRLTASAALEHRWFSSCLIPFGTQLENFESWQKDLRATLGFEQRREVKQPRGLLESEGQGPQAGGAADTHAADADAAAGGFYIADNSELRAPTAGLAYRVSKRHDDKHQQGLTVAWGSIVRGIDEGDGWLKSGSHYLPLEVKGIKVLVKQQEAQVETEMVSPVSRSLPAPQDTFGWNCRSLAAMESQGLVQLGRTVDDTGGGRAQTHDRAVDTVASDAGAADVSCAQEANQTSARSLPCAVDAPDLVPRQLSQEELQICCDKTDAIGYELTDVIAELDKLLAGAKM